MKISLVDDFAQCVIFFISISNSSYFISIIYASYENVYRKLLWEYLDNSNFGENHPLILGGDFNMIRSNSEKISGIVVSSSSIEEFNNYISTLRLVKLMHTCNQMTWCNSGRGVHGIY